MLINHDVSLHDDVHQGILNYFRKQRTRAIKALRRNSKSFQSAVEKHVSSTNLEDELDKLQEPIIFKTDTLAEQIAQTIRHRKRTRKGNAKNDIRHHGTGDLADHYALKTKIQEAESLGLTELDDIPKGIFQRLSHSMTFSRPCSQSSGRTQGK